MFPESKIFFDEKSKSLIARWEKNALHPLLLDQEGSLALHQLIEWLSKDLEVKTPENDDFLLPSLIITLLKALHQKIHPNLIEKEEDEPDFWDKVIFILLAISGSLLAACEGFDGITTLMSIVTFPPLLILLVGIVFSALSIVVFCGYELVQISEILGVSLSDAPQLLDLYLAQLREIKKIKAFLASLPLAECSAEDLNIYMSVVAMLDIRFKQLTAIGDQDKNNKDPQLAKTIFAVLAGISHFGAGFFAGQSVAIFVLNFVCIGGVTATFWPVILFSALVGLAAFNLYWHIERPALKKLISGWFGLNEDDMEALCNKDLVAAEQKQIDTLAQQISSTSVLVEEGTRQRTLSACRDSLYFGRGERLPEEKVRERRYSI